ncbi:MULTISPECIES: LytR C-terminal domain-containing protein [unclassified Arthrobacter]|uniref:LytR C-terminal domain-containing protein n=1 Tax=unclassified Arthrobacter TaxID=235627 RepID=UPI0006F470D3|nr:LytR C-terminal domain-containing protein [Arthrobacter sp. Leaf234]KQO01523.1 hypothetical protein ASF21_07775 [Arthrobacter sp. Leaf234]
MTEHPRDEFDRVPETSERQGVHRERLIPAGSGGLALKITVGILALLIGLGAYLILPRLGLVGGDAAGTPAAATSPSQEPAVAPSGSTTPADGAADGNPPTEADGASTSPSDDDEDGVDRTRTVNVLNGTGSPGLASVAAGRLAEEGWGSVLPGNWAGAPVDSSVVFYNGEEQRIAAEAVAEDLGITDLVDSADVSPDVSVVLGPEFR